jgi:hypothetical protein
VDLGAVLDAAEEPLYVSDVAVVLGLNVKAAWHHVKGLCDAGQLLVSDRPVFQSWLEGEERVERRGRLYVRVDSPKLLEGMNVQIRVRRLERHTERVRESKVWVRFVPKTKTRKVRLTEKKVLAFVNERKAVTSQDVAQRFDGVDIKHAATYMIRLTRRGKVLQCGVMSEQHRRQFPFAWGWMYAPVGHPEYVDQVLQKRTDLIPGELQLLRNMVGEYSRRGKFLPTMVLRERHGWTVNDVNSRSRQAMKIWSDLRTKVINKNLFLYTDWLSKEHIQEESRYWREELSEERRRKYHYGLFHEAYVQKAFTIADEKKDVMLQHVFWRIRARGGLRYTYRTAPNRKEIDRVLQIESRVVNKKDAAYGVAVKTLVPMDFKAVGKGVTPKMVWQFYNKLRFSWEFGTVTEVTEKGQKAKVHVLRGGVTPVMVSPYFTEDALEVCRKLGIQAVHTYNFDKYLQSIGFEKATMKRLFKEFLKNPKQDYKKFLDKRLA